MAGESFVQVSPDSSGKRIRNESVDMPQSDGTTQTVNVQIVRLAEADRATLDELLLVNKRQLAATLLLLDCFRSMPGHQAVDEVSIDDLDSLVEDIT